MCSMMDDHDDGGGGSINVTQHLRNINGIKKEASELHMLIMMD